ncbi:hypothetical protein P256_00472 [Acinetobacter nectaris CIP 110549]|uniref:N-acylglucosamine 2-epimerase n=1 Tax=Acinetobacter nectaris CIP 110549 TaxID=1392540 RepID=V2TBM3_9GAMM|nr:AGE family epimerase/isomerase [Acinetobacter nectaris]ESK40033.1 hypothetical protein P256_00472 [Acinetobacter nectaris CIP 110549]
MKLLTKVRHSWLNQTAHIDWLKTQTLNLLDFYQDAQCQYGGFIDLDRYGLPLHQRPNTLNTARFTYCYSLAAIRGYAGSVELAEWGIKSLNEHLFDHKHGGWLSSLVDDSPNDRKKSYLHAFVLLAANSAKQANIAGADALFDKAVNIFNEHFWSETENCVLESYAPDWSDLEKYRGANCNMHSLEMFMQLAITTQDSSWLKKSLAIVERIIHEHAKNHDYSVVEHFDEKWKPDYEFNKNKLIDDFRPYGVTPGHGFEWCHLLINLEQELQVMGLDVPQWLLEDAQGLFDTAWKNGWQEKPHRGIIYTYDWKNEPVVRERLHWVHAEAAVASATLMKRLNDEKYEVYYRKIIGYIHHTLVDEKHGSWFQDLDKRNNISNLIWNGKPDLYHAFLMTLKLPMLLDQVLLQQLKPVKIK